MADAIKKGHTKDTRLGAVEDYLNWHKQDRPYPPDMKLIQQIYGKKTSDRNLDHQIKNLIKTWCADFKARNVKKIA